MRRRLLATGILLWAPAVLAGNWEVVDEESTLEFTATQRGSEFRGRFREFTADMTFYEDRPGDSAFAVTVDVTSVTTGARDRDEALADKAWFWFEKFPEARFETKAIHHEGGNAYEAIADLTIKSNTHEVVLPFTWKEDGDTAEMEGTVTAVMQGGLTMDRTRWDVGTGEWSEGDTIGRQVGVHVDLLLRRSGNSG